MLIMDIVEEWNMRNNMQLKTIFQSKNVGFFKVADNGLGMFSVII